MQIFFSWLLATASTNIKKNFETGWTIHSIKISIEYLKILY